MSYANKFFDNVFCINLDRRQDRMALAQKELEKFNIVFERFSAVDGNSLDKGNYTTNPDVSSGIIGCTLSHAKLLSICKERGYEKVLILEDDIILNDNFEEKLVLYIKEIPAYWDMFYLGGNHNFHNGEKINMISEHIGQCNMTFSTHAYAIHSRLFDDAIFLLSQAQKPVDVYYSEIQKKRSIYTFYPGIANQRAGYSDILNSKVDYTDIIK